MDLYKSEIMKRFYQILLTVVMMSFLGVSASAITYTASPNRASIRNYDEAYTAMYEAVSKGAEIVDISEYGIKTDDILSIYSDILASAPELFYLDNRITYYYNRGGLSNTVTKVRFEYKMNEVEREEAKLAYEQELSYIVSQVDVKMSDAEKALWVHDYLISAFEYDVSQSFYDAYSLFRERKGVCQAYSLAYIAVLRELGINAVMVASDEMNHAWNLVEIDGEWYHVDLVFDDPAPDRMGRVMHDNFLLDDSMITETEDPHYGWKSTIKCSSSTYNDAVWRDISSRMLYFEEQWYYIDNNTGTLAVSEANGEYRSDIYTFENKWFVEGNEERYWVGIYSGVSEMFGYIFVNTPYEVIAYNPRTGASNVFLEAESGERIFGSQIYKNTLEYLIADAPNTPLESEGRRVGTFTITDFSLDDLAKPFPFDDVSRLDGYYASVRYVYDKGLFQGVSSTKFAPDAPLTRAMFVTVLGRLCNVNANAFVGSAFDDVEAGRWYTPYVEWAAVEGLVNGVGGNRFDPMGEITREQMIKMVAQLGRLLRCGKTEISDTLLLYDDRMNISDWAVESVAYCAANDLIDNSGELLPGGSSSRAEAAEIIARFAVLCGIA